MVAGEAPTSTHAAGPISPDLSLRIPWRTLALVCSVTTAGLLAAVVTVLIRSDAAATDLALILAILAIFVQMTSTIGQYAHASRLETQLESLVGRLDAEAARVERLTDGVLNLVNLGVHDRFEAARESGSPEDKAALDQVEPLLVDTPAPRLAADREWKQRLRAMIDTLGNEARAHGLTVERISGPQRPRLLASDGTSAYGLYMMPGQAPVARWVTLAQEACAALGEERGVDVQPVLALQVRPSDAVTRLAEEAGVRVMWLDGSRPVSAPWETPTTGP